jgi:fumarate reductase subunit D
MTNLQIFGLVCVTLSLLCGVATICSSRDYNVCDVDSFQTFAYGLAIVFGVVATVIGILT